MDKVLFAHIEWMKRYKGLSNDNISRNTSFVKEHGIGCEIFNFLNLNGKVYGYVPVNGGCINIKKLGAEDGDAYVDNVLVIFTAFHEAGGVYPVGWYKKAKIYREFVDEYMEERCVDDYNYYGYNIEADYDDAVLIPDDERLSFEPIPIASVIGKGGKGTQGIWYADSERDVIINFRKKILSQIQRYEMNLKKRNKLGIVSAECKREVEKIAVEVVCKYYKSLGYEIESVERDNLGWDLNITNRANKLKVEVKGTASNEILVNISPNEYKNMMLHKNNGYRLCIVRNCLKEPVLHCFSYVPEEDVWIDYDGNALQQEEVIALRCRIDISNQ